MSPLAFFDTNVVLYSDDMASPAKHATARALLKSHLIDDAAVFSLQVLQEYYAVATKKLKIDPTIAQQKVELLGDAKIIRFSSADVIAAIELHRLGNISFWDALIVHAARISGAAVLYSEDLHAGASFGGVKVVNPFKGKSPLSS